MKIYAIRSYADALMEAGLLVSCSIVNETLAIEHITYNSKATKPYSLFACKGAAFKKEYLDEAIDNGIACYLSEVEYDTNLPVSHLIVTDIRKGMALVADLFYDHAYRKLKLTGITGTKGKSTTAYYLKYILDEHLQSIGQKPCGIVSSIDCYDGKSLQESHLTTPEAFELHQHFDNAVQSGLTYFIMEVSSQALKYERVLGVDFDLGIFLNISEDHISPIEHNDFEDYFSSKLKLFSQSDTAIVNLDSDFSERVLQAADRSRAVITFGKEETADLFCYDVKKVGLNTHFTVRSKEVDGDFDGDFVEDFDGDFVEDFVEDFVLTMPGLFNVENALAAIAAARHYGIPFPAIQRGLYQARSSGRMEIFTSRDNSVIAIVDYAHNKLSFEKLFQSTLEEYKGRSIITVFGCPGGKAFNRRKELGELSGEYSDRVYLTMDNPGHETVADINRDIQQYVLHHDCECILIEERGEAIRAAILDAPKNSIVLIAGKGQETSQVVADGYAPYRTDAAYAKEYLELVPVQSE